MPVTYGLCALIFGAYVAWVVVRYRREKEQKAAGHGPRPMPEMPLAPPVATPAPAAPSIAAPAPALAVPHAATAPMPVPATAGAGYPTAPPTEPTTVLRVLAGISLPSDLCPLTSATPRPHVRDQVVFATDTTPHETVRTTMEAALTAIGVQVDWIDVEQAILTRDGHEAAMVLPLSPVTASHGTATAYPVLLPHTVVVDIWVP